MRRAPAVTVIQGVRMPKAGDQRRTGRIPGLLYADEAMSRAMKAADRAARGDRSGTSTTEDAVVPHYRVGGDRFSLILSWCTDAGDSSTEKKATIAGLTPVGDDYETAWVEPRFEW